MLAQSIEHEKEYKALEVSSRAFKPGDMIPSRYTCEGMDINPPLDIQGIPNEARSLVLIVEGPDAPGGTWLHWLVWNIPITHHIRENGIPGSEGMNDFGTINYGGPCPPSGKHRYFFKVYALDALLNVAERSKRHELEDAMRDHILAYGELVGVYQKK
jgi:Raf kinase inhibitor-like YbhB/YbcL family protein